MELTSPRYEQALLGAILLDNKVLEDYAVSSILFDSGLAEKVFRVIQEIIASGARANIVEVGARLPDDAGYVARLTDTPSAANAGFYVAELRDLARRRALVGLSRDIVDMVRDGDNTTDQIFEACDRAMLSVSDDRESGYRSAADCIIGALDMIKKAYDNQGHLSGIDTGFRELNLKTNGWQPRTVNVIGARPGAGKTSIALNMASAALRADKVVGFFSAEMNAASIVKRMVADWGNADYSRMNSGYLNDGDMPRIEAACEKIADARLFINDRPGIALDELVQDARRMRRKERVNIIFIDYLSLVANQKKGMPRHEQVAEISWRLKVLAGELDIPIVVLSQLTREAQGERPKLSQLRDSGAVEQDADIVILMWNKGYTDDTKSAATITLIVEKHRNGPTGDIDMIFVPARMRFRELDRQEGTR
jgi:replicative DNA helicase